MPEKISGPKIWSCESALMHWSSEVGTKLLKWCKSTNSIAVSEADPFLVYSLYKTWSCSFCLLWPGFHYTASATTTTQKQSDYRVEQSSFTLIALFWLEIGRCRSRNWLNGNQIYGAYFVAHVFKYLVPNFVSWRLA